MGESGEPSSSSSSEDHTTMIATVASVVVVAMVASIVVAVVILRKRRQPAGDDQEYDIPRVEVDREKKSKKRKLGKRKSEEELLKEEKEVDQLIEAQDASLFVPNLFQAQRISFAALEEALAEEEGMRTPMDDEEQNSLNSKRELAKQDFQNRLQSIIGEKKPAEVKKHVQMERLSMIENEQDKMQEFEVTIKQSTSRGKKR